MPAGDDPAGFSMSKNFKENCNHGQQDEDYDTSGHDRVFGTHIIWERKFATEYGFLCVSFCLISFDCIGYQPDHDDYKRKLHEIT